jgi:hypothetical protein
MKLFLKNSKKPETAEQIEIGNVFSDTMGDIWYRAYGYLVCIKASSPIRSITTCYNRELFGSGGFRNVVVKEDFGKLIVEL